MKSLLKKEVNILARGRKKKENSFVNTISIKITDKQKETLLKNNWLKEEIDEIVRIHLDLFIMK